MNRIIKVCLCLLVVGCKPVADKLDPDASGPPAVTEVGKPTGPMTTQTIGPSGGTLSSSDGRLTLTIPAGALSRETVLTVEPVENTAPNGVGRGYHFGPAGTQFVKSATWTYRYEPEEINGISTEAVAMVMQKPDHTWRFTQGAKVDPATQTITSTIHHFSWFSMVTQYRLMPEAAKVLVYTKKEFDVQYLNTKEGFEHYEEHTGSDDDLLAPDPVVAPVNSIKSVTLNGKESGGDAGRVSVLRQRDKAILEYQAPDQVPKTNPVALTVEIQHKGKAQFLLTSAVNVVPPTTFQVEGRAFKNATGVAHLVRGPLGTILQIAISDQDSPTGQAHSLSVQLKDPVVGSFPFGKTVQVDGFFPTRKRISYSSAWEEPDGSMQYAEGKVVLTDIGGTYLEGSVSGSLVYHNQPTKASPRVHEPVKFEATFLIGLSRQ